MSKQPSTSNAKPNQPHPVPRPGASRGPSTSDDVFTAPPETPKNRNATTEVITSEATTTPSARAYGTGATDIAKTRVDIETSRWDELAGSRCLLENTTSEENSVEYAHCLFRATDDKVLFNLEYSWGIRARTLNVDSRYNIFKLSVKFHRLFDEGRWILLPEENIVTTYLNSLPKPVSIMPVQPPKLPDIYGPPYRYTLVAHPAMGAVPFLRQKKDTIVKATNENRDSTLSLKDFDYLSFPFTGIDKIVSHIHPRFVICEVGLAMMKNISFRGSERVASFEYFKTEHSKTIIDITTIYNSWSTLYTEHKKSGVPSAVRFKNTGHWREAEADNSVTKTASVRVASGALKRRRSHADNDSH